MTTKRNEYVTVTISINVAAGNKWEGNSETHFIVPEGMLKDLSIKGTAKNLEAYIEKAIKEYEKRNK